MGLGLGVGAVKQCLALIGWKWCLQFANHFGILHNARCHLNLTAVRNVKHRAGSFCCRFWEVASHSEIIASEKS